MCPLPEHWTLDNGPYPASKWTQACLPLSRIPLRNLNLQHRNEVTYRMLPPHERRHKLEGLGCINILISRACILVCQKKNIPHPRHRKTGIQLFILSQILAYNKDSDKKEQISTMLNP